MSEATIHWQNNQIWAESTHRKRIVAHPNRMKWVKWAYKRAKIIENSIQNEPFLCQKTLNIHRTTEIIEIWTVYRRCKIRFAQSNKTNEFYSSKNGKYCVNNRVNTVNFEAFFLFGWRARESKRVSL